MKYVAFVFLIIPFVFGIFHCSKKEEANSTSQKILEIEMLVDSIESTSISISPIQEDTTTYSEIDGYYDISWKDLSKVDFEEKLNTEFNTMIAYPIFHPSIKKLDGQKIQIKGYVIPFEETGDATIVILSAFPFSNCFFCGGAGPETVMDVQLKKQNSSFKLDAMVSFRGKLRLNDSDLDYLNYILDEAVILD